MDDMWHHVEQDEECFHCLFENWMKDDPGMSDLLSCPLSDEVRSSVVSYSLFALGYSHCTTTSCLLCSQESQQVIGLWCMNVVYNTYAYVMCIIPICAHYIDAMVIHTRCDLSAVVLHH